MELEDEMVRVSGVPEEVQGRTFLGFAPATDADAAAARFKERFGVAPAWVVDVPNTLLVGPVPVADHRPLTADGGPISGQGRLL